MWRKKKKQTAQSQGPSRLFHILTACPKRNTVSKNGAHGKQGPPHPPHLLCTLRRKDSPVTVAPQVPRLPKHALPGSVRSLHWQLSGQFQSFSHRFVFIVSVVWHHFFFFRVVRVATRHLPSLTLLQLKWLYSRVTTEANMFFCESWKTLASWKVLFSEDRFLFKARLRPFLWEDCLVFCGLCRRTFFSEVGLCKLFCLRENERDLQWVRYSGTKFGLRGANEVFD